MTEIMVFPRHCGTAAVADKTNIKKLKSICFILCLYIWLSFTLCLQV